jgi:predicted nucleic acid binding AN1-type Zn finger protein
MPLSYAMVMGSRETTICDKTRIDALFIHSCDYCILYFECLFRVRYNFFNGEMFDVYDTFSIQEKVS